MSVKVLIRNARFPTCSQWRWEVDCTAARHHRGASLSYWPHSQTPPATQNMLLHTILHHNAWYSFFQILPLSGSTLLFHAVDKNHLSAGGCYCCPHLEPEKVAKPFKKAQSEVQVGLLVLRLTCFTPCWVWVCQREADYLWSPWWFDPRICSDAAFRHKPGQQGLKVTCWQSTLTSIHGKIYIKNDS